MNTGRVVVAGFLACLVLVGCSEADDPVERSAQCDPPQLTVSVPPVGDVGSGESPVSARPTDSSAPAVLGGMLRVQGSGFGTGCVTKGGSAVPSGPSIERMRLYMVRGDTKVSVAQISADPTTYAFDVILGVPTDVGAGRAELIAFRDGPADSKALASKEFTIVEG